jgi:hypothetical protein
MMRLFVLGVLTATLVATEARARIVVMLTDEFDDVRLIGSVAQVQAVTAFRKQIVDFNNRLHFLRIP